MREPAFKTRRTSPTSANTRTALAEKIVANTWKAVAAAGAALVAIFASGFSAGMKYAEGQANVKLAESSGALSQTQTKLIAAQGRIDQLLEAQQRDQQRLAQSDTEIARLASQVERSSGCVALEREIKETRAEIARLRDPWLAARGQSAQDDVRTRLAALETRLGALQQQLGACSK